MEQSNAPRTEIPQIGLGTVPLGNYRRAISDDDALGVLTRAYELGVRYFDTAPLYGSGLAEQRVGRFLSMVDRADVVVSTKVGRLLSHSAEPDPNLMDNGVPIYRDIPSLHPYVDFSSEGVRRSLDESLNRLGVDYLDVVYVHDPEGYEDQVAEEAIPTLSELKSEGLIGQIGVGSTSVASMLQLVSRVDLDCAMIASHWTLLERGAGPELLPLCARRNVHVVIAGVFNSGVLASTDGNTTFHYRTAGPDVLSRVDRLRRIAESFEVPLAAAALKFPLRAGRAASIVVGAQSTHEIEEDLRLLEFEIPEPFWTAVGADAL